MKSLGSYRRDVKLQQLKRLGENPAANDDQSKGFNSDILSPDLGSFYYTHNYFSTTIIREKEKRQKFLPVLTTGSYRRHWWLRDH